jgi:hypothetical protein
MSPYDTFPSYLDIQTKQWLVAGALRRKWGNLNVYTCESCGLQNVTTDVDEGTTPFIIKCDECGGMAQSCMYRIAWGSPLVPTKAWYRPESLIGLDRETEDHVRGGGLILRELTHEERTALGLVGAVKDVAR